MSEEIVVRPITRGLERSVGEYTGVFDDVGFLLSRSGKKICTSCGELSDFLSPAEFVDRVQQESHSQSPPKDAVIDVELLMPPGSSDPSVTLPQMMDAGFVRGRINGEAVRFEEWGEGEAIRTLTVTVDRIRSTAADLRARIFHAFSLISGLGAIGIGANSVLTSLGEHCLSCGAPALVACSNGVTSSQFSSASFAECKSLVSQISLRILHPDGLIRDDLIARLQVAALLGIAELKMDRLLGTLSAGERYRLALCARVFANVVGLEFELKDAGVTFGGKDAERISSHIRYLREVCGAEVDASQLEACLAPDFHIDSNLSISSDALGESGAFRLGEGLVASRNRISSLNGLSGSGKSRLLNREIGEFSRVVRLSSDDRRSFKNKTVGSLLGLAKPLREFYSGHPHARVAGLKPSSFSGLLPGERSRATQREYDLVRTVKFKGLSYDETLRSDVETLLVSFRHFPRLGSRLKLLHEMGLGFVRPIDLLRSFTPPIQRLLRLVEAMTSNPAGGTLYVLDGMLTGLSSDQQERVIKQFEALCSRGSTVITTNLVTTSASL